MLLMKEIDYVFKRVRIQLSMDEAAARSVFQRHRWLLMMSGRRLRQCNKVLFDELGGRRETAEAVTAEARLLRIRPWLLKATLRMLKKVGLEGDSLLAAMKVLFVSEMDVDMLQVRWSIRIQIARTNLPT